MKSKIVITLLVIFTSLTNITNAHDAHYQDTKPRTWHTKSGDISASFYLAKNNQVLLEKPNGTVISLPLSDLCESDIAFVNQKIQWIQNQPNPSKHHRPTTIQCAHGLPIAERKARSHVLCNFAFYWTRNQVHSVLSTIKIHPARHRRCFVPQHK